VETLALPLRVRPDGRLQKTDPVTSVLSVIRAMAASPASTWAHAPWFGLQEHFASVNPRLENHPALADALNRGLAELGVGWIRVTEVKLSRPAPAGAATPGTHHFDLTMVTADGTAVHRRVSP
jgi:hypothetical protein